MGLTFKKSSPWTPEEDKILKENSAKSMKELLEIFPNRTKGSVIARKNTLGIANKSMHSWTEKEIQILKDNADLSSEAIHDKYFPELTICNIRSARRKYDCVKKKTWDTDKIERFRVLYQEGGHRAVKEDPEFSDINKAAINGAAHRYNVQSAAARPTTWTEEEKDICRLWLAIPVEQRPPRKTLAEQIPAHSISGIKDMCRRLTEEG